MKNILEAPFLKEICKTASNMYRQGWDERNGGNISVRLDQKDLTPYLNLYDTWSRYEPETEGVFVAYASIHGGTAEAALRLVEILRAKGAPKVAVSDLAREDLAEAIEENMDGMDISFDHARFPLSSSDKELPEAKRRNPRERQLGALGRQDDALDAGADEGHYRGRTPGHHPQPYEGSRRGST